MKSIILAITLFACSVSASPMVEIAKRSAQTTIYDFRGTPLYEGAGDSEIHGAHHSGSAYTLSRFTSTPSTQDLWLFAGVSLTANSTGGVSALHTYELRALQDAFYQVTFQTSSFPEPRGNITLQATIARTDRTHHAELQSVGVWNDSDAFYGFLPAGEVLSITLGIDSTTDDLGTSTGFPVWTDGATTTMTATFAAVPEPSAGTLYLLALVLMAARRRRKGVYRVEACGDSWALRSGSARHGLPRQSGGG